MKEPRYKVATCEGYLIGAADSPRKVPGLGCHVLDTHLLHRCVATFRSEDRLKAPGTKGGGGTIGREGALQAAQARCDQLNAEHERRERARADGESEQVRRLIALLSA